MTHAYNELYLDDAKKTLSTALDYAINFCQCEANLFSRLFVQSGVAEQFERGNPAIISGKSGVEIVREIFGKSDNSRTFPEYTSSPNKSPEFWSGWALAQYQWLTSKRFKDIFSRIPLSEIISMYPVYHEMDLTRFIESMDAKYAKAQSETKLKKIRENRGISQSELAKLSGVSLRSIQLYEQRVNDIDKAQAQTLYKLSRVLGCSVESLLENPQD